MRALVLLTALSLTGLYACAPKGPVDAPTAKGECYYLADQKDGTIRKNLVAEKIPNIEQCAAELERMRLNFLRMGGSNYEIVGAYQGTFIMLKREGIFTAKHL